MRKRQVFLLHYAGGNIYSFRFMESYFRDFEMIALELPGRGRRMTEALLTDFDAAAADLAAQISQYSPRPGFILYGHSMGALLALQVALLLEEMDLSPGYLVVSGNPGPGIKEATFRYLMDKEDFKKELHKLGGMPSEIFVNKELFDFFEPILRADFQLAETGNLRSFASVRCPIYAMMGQEEEYVEELPNWKNCTQSNFDSEVIAGDHFFIYQCPGRMAEIFRRCHSWLATAAL